LSKKLTVEVEGVSREAKSVLVEGDWKSECSVRDWGCC